MPGYPSYVNDDTVFHDAIQDDVLSTLNEQIKDAKTNVHNTQDAATQTTNEHNESHNMTMTTKKKQSHAISENTKKKEAHTNENSDVHTGSTQTITQNDKTNEQKNNSENNTQNSTILNTQNKDTKSTAESEELSGHDISEWQYTKDRIFASRFCRNWRDFSRKVKVHVFKTRPREDCVCSECTKAHFGYANSSDEYKREQDMLDECENRIYLVQKAKKEKLQQRIQEMLMFQKRFTKGGKEIFSGHDISTWQYIKDRIVVSTFYQKCYDAYRRMQAHIFNTRDYDNCPCLVCANKRISYHRRDYAYSDQLHFEELKLRERHYRIHLVEQARREKAQLQQEYEEQEKLRKLKIKQKVQKEQDEINKVKQRKKDIIRKARIDTYRGIKNKEAEYKNSQYMYKYAYYDSKFENYYHDKHTLSGFLFKFRRFPIPLRIKSFFTHLRYYPDYLCECPKCRHWLNSIYKDTACPL